MEATGTWRYDGGGYFDCFGRSNDTGDYGIGCSNGVFPNYKVIPKNSSKADPNSGTGDVCQEKPYIWKEDCAKAKFSFRCVNAENADNVKG